MKTFIPALALLAFTLSATAQAETLDCTAITTVPYTIVTPGAYCFTKHLKLGWSTIAIRIDSSDVVLDLNGYKLEGPGTEPGGTGIFAGERQNVTVRNGTVGGFLSGVSLLGSSLTSKGYVIEDIRVVNNFSSGITTEGNGSVIRNNHVEAIGPNPNNPAYLSYAISVGGPAARVLNNDVIGVTSNGKALGILVGVATNSVVAGNRISSITSPALTSYGIMVNLSTESTTSSHKVILKDNIVTDSQYGIYYNYGSTGKYMNNLTEGVVTPYTGGTAAGTTNY